MTMTSLQEQAIEKSKYWIDFANDRYRLNITYPTISFKLKGRCAGKANYTKHLVKYNAVLLEENGDTFLERTVPHEIAHIVVRHKYGHYATAHGYEWKSMMMAFGCNPSRCHSYDTTNSAQGRKSKLGKNFDYKCGCKIYNLTVIRHRRILKGAIYTCRNCKTPLTAVTAV